jgi:hypothetical protein
MNNAGPLADRSKKELADMARRRGIRGWETLSKEALIKAIARQAPSPSQPAKSSRPSVSTQKSAAKSVPAPVKTAAKPAARPTPKPVAKEPVRPVAKPVKLDAKLPLKATAKSVAKVTKPAPKTTKNPAAPPSAPVHQNGTASRPAAAESSHPPANKHEVPAPKAAPVKAAPAKPAPAKPASAKPAPVAAPVKEAAAPVPPLKPGGPTKDRIIMAVNDPYWLHVYWELSAQSVQRAEAALKQDWYGARLIIRLYDVTSQDTTSTSETPIRDIPIESDGSDWYINVPQPPRQYRADLGYLSRRGYFFILARSNVVTPPKAGSSEAIDVGWNMDTKKAERILAMSTGFESSGNPELRELFEERLKRSLGAPKETGFGTGATPPGSLKKFFFDIDAKLIVLGRTDPSAHLTLGNDPIKLNADGTFIMSFSLPDSRQIIPAVATSSDGVEERTIVLAVERNTKYLDPMIHDQMNEI